MVFLYKAVQCFALVPYFEVFEEAARHYHGPGLAALIVVIAAINAWNRLNVITRQPAGSWS